MLLRNIPQGVAVHAIETRPGSGATVAFLEASTRHRAYYLGLTEPDHVVMIGDTMETDIRGAVEAGMQPSINPAPVRP